MADVEIPIGLNDPTLPSVNIVSTTSPSQAAQREANLGTDVSSISDSFFPISVPIPGTKAPRYKV